MRFVEEGAFSSVGSSWLDRIFHTRHISDTRGQLLVLGIPPLEVQQKDMWSHYGGNHKQTNKRERHSLNVCVKFVFILS